MTIKPPTQVFEFSAKVPDGDRMDAQFADHARSIESLARALEDIRRSDGALKNHIITSDTLHPDLVEALTARVRQAFDEDATKLRAYVADTHRARNQALQARDLSEQAASHAIQSAEVVNERAGGALQAAVSAATRIEEAQARVAIIVPHVTNAENDALAAAAVAQDWAIASMNWAEYLGGPGDETIPPNTLAIMGITGDHWSSKWWSTKANDASGEAINAANEAKAAAEDAVAAAEEALAAADELGDLFLGSKPADPTVDNDGNTLQEGALYFNTTTDQMMVWNGSSWQSFSGSSIAQDVVFAPAGTLSSTNVQLALEELDGDVQALDTRLDAAEAGLVNAYTKAQSDTLFVDAAGDTMTGPLLIPLGAGAAPSLAFAGDPDTGIFSQGPNGINIAAGGASRVVVTTGSFSTTVPFRGQDGTAAAPTLSFSADTDNGIYRITTDTVGFATAGTLRLTLSTTALTSTLPLALPVGGAATPSISFGDADTGIYGIGTAAVGITTSGVARLTVSDATVTSNNNIICTAGGIYSQAPAAQNAHIWFRDDAALNQGVLFWNRAGDAMTLRRYNAAGSAAEGELALNDGTANGLKLNTQTIWNNGNFPVDIVTTPPTSNSGLVWNGTKYVPGNAGGAIVGDAAPTPPSNGMLWWQSNSGSLNLWYDDPSADTGQWVQVGGGGLPEAPVDGKPYLRQNNGWLEGYSKSTGDAALLAKVSKSGDTMTGSLYFDMNNPGVILNTKLSGQSMLLLGQTTSKNRWAVYLGNGTPESGANVGSDFNIQRFSDAGTYIDTPLAINRATGAVMINGATAGAGKAPGDIFTTARITPPAGALAADGSAVLLASYPKLVDIYCGDAKNPTAQWGFKCTNPANPTGSRSTAGTYIALPDCRTYFVRGWNSATRDMYMYEAAMTPEHTHYIPGYQPTGSFTQTGSAVVLAQGGNTNTSAAFVGGTENRPANIAFLCCVQYA